MTIKQIAQIAKVSPSTVSKILNHKDEHISAKTRKRVLEVIELYQYSPHAKAIERSVVRSKLIGVLVSSITSSHYANIVKSLERQFIKRGYNIILCNTEDNIDIEINAVRLLQSRHAEGFIFVSDAPKDATKDLMGETPYLTLSPTSNINSISFNYSQAIDILMRNFFKKNHHRIALVISECEKHLVRYYRNQLEKNDIVFDESIVFTMENDLSNIPKILEIALNTGANAILASNMGIAYEIYNYLSIRLLTAGQDFSLAAFDDQDSPHNMSPNLTCIKLPFDELARIASDTMINLVEKTATTSPNHNLVDVSFCPGGSITENAGEKKPSITVVGTINMDIILKVSHFPAIGESITIEDKTILPGGRGANQAMGAAKLGAHVNMIGRLGNDLYGKELYHNLHSMNINVNAVVFDDNYATGRAYIYVDKEGDYSIGVHAGAGAGLDAAHIDSFKDKILHADFCLVQTGIPMETVEYLGQLCKDNGIPMILNPSSTKALSDQLLSNTYIIVVNLQGLNRVVPDILDMESQVEHLLKRGSHKVIVSLSEKGCYYCDGTIKKYYPAIKTTVVDTTSASDAFISALAVYLAEGACMDVAIKYANIAAGISVSGIGVQSALADKKTIEAAIKPHVTFALNCQV